MTNLTPLLSIVIPAFNGAAELERCLRSVFENNLESVQVIAVNDGSDDPMVETVMSSFDVIYIPSEKNIGRGPARNLGAAQATGEYLLFLDADIEVPNSIFDQVKTILKKNPDIEVFFGSYDDAPACSGTISQYRNLLHHYTHQIADDFAPHFWTGFGVVKTSVFRQVGGFDQGKWARDMEEVDLGYRLNEAGHRIRLFKDLQLKHLKSYTLANMVRSDLISRAIPWTLFIRENHSPSNEFVTSSRQRLSAVAIVLIFCVVFLPVIGLPALIVSLFGAVSFVWLNSPFFKFCFESRGGMFMLKSILLHLVHIFCAGMGYGIGSLIYFFQKLKKSLGSSDPAMQSNLNVSKCVNKESE